MFGYGRSNGRCARLKIPFTLTATLNADLMDHVDGGITRGALFIIGLEAAGSWKTDFGWRGYVDVMVDSDGRFSQRYSGDLQSVSSIDAVPATHLYELWLRKTVGDKRRVTTVAIMNLNRILDVQPVGGLFLNSSSGIGPDYSQKDGARAIVEREQVLGAGIFKLGGWVYTPPGPNFYAG